MQLYDWQADTQICYNNYMECCIDNCNKEVLARGLCNGHYGRWRRGADLNAPMRHLHQQTTCGLDFCNEPYHAAGLCHAHHQRKIDGRPMNTPINKITNKRNHVLFSTWVGMKARCKYISSPSYKNYGGRGITVCDRWLDFWHFVEDMGAKPTPQHTIERINNDLGYSPENCVWATRKEQMLNRRMPEPKPIRLCSVENCEKKHLALSYCKKHYRLYKQGKTL